jgi:hypothetical protein
VLTIPNHPKLNKFSIETQAFWVPFQETSKLGCQQTKVLQHRKFSRWHRTDCWNCGSVIDSSGLQDQKELYNSTILAKKTVQTSWPGS